MAYVPVTVPRDRNGLVGDFGTYAPVRMSFEEIVARRRSGLVPQPQGRTSDLVSSHGDLDLVRYRIGSDEHARDDRAIGGDGMGMRIAREYPFDTAVFGVVDRRDDAALAMVTVFDEGRDHGLNVTDYQERDGLSPGTEAMLSFMRLLDVPPSYQQGADMRFARFLDLWYDPDAAAWGRREPVHAVAVAFGRTCYQTSPVVDDKVSVLVPEDPAHDLGSSDPDAADLAKDHYRGAGWEALGDLDHGVRPGFSSWTCEGEPRRVKVLEESLYARFAPGRVEAEPDAAPGPGGP